MPILQNKLVMKSIEALHDEALSLMPDTARSRNVTAPPAVLHVAKPPQESPIVTPKDTLATAQPGSTGNQDIMARIDHLLKKLDDVDDVSIKPLAGEGPQPSIENIAVDDSHAANMHDIVTDNSAKTDSPVLSDVADYAHGDTVLHAGADKMAEETADKPFGDTVHDASNDATDDVSDNIFANDQPGVAASPNQTQALADIARAIYQSQQQSADATITDVSQNNSTTVDMDVLSATVTDEVRRTVSAVIAAELPEMVRKAFSEALRALPADELGHSKPTTRNPPTTKSVTARKTATTKKTVAKKAGIKKSASKKAASKTTPKKKLSAKKGGTKKTTAKKSAP